MQNQNMIAGSLLANDVSSRVWQPKFAAGQVSMHLISSCNNIGMVAKIKKIMRLGMRMQNFAINTNLRTQIFGSKKSSVESLTTRTCGRPHMVP